MKNSFFPLGYRPQTEEQISELEYREKLYDYYGIPYGVFDDPKNEIEDTEIEKDRTTARILIMQGEKIPEDLEKRLLDYKEKERIKEK